jgi:hypothetical protein
MSNPFLPPCIERSSNTKREEPARSAGGHFSRRHTQLHDLRILVTVAKIANGVVGRDHSGIDVSEEVSHDAFSGQLTPGASTK